MSISILTNNHPRAPPSCDLNYAPPIADLFDGWTETSITSLWLWEDYKESKSILSSGSDWSYWCSWKHSGLWNMLKCLLFCSVSCLYFYMMLNNFCFIKPIIPVTQSLNMALISFCERGLVPHGKRLGFHLWLYFRDFQFKSGFSK